MNNTHTAYLEHAKHRCLADLHGGIFSDPVVYSSDGSIPIEVLCVTSARVPNQAQLHELWKKRSGRRPAPLLLIVFCNKTASICGVNVVNLGVYHNLSIEFARNLATALLKFSDIYDATSFAERYMHSLDKNYSIPGILNNGFASSYELYENVPKYKSWSKAKKLAHQCRDKTNLDLISSLGFTLPHSPPPLPIF